jgi:hypothetical protein
LNYQKNAKHHLCEFFPSTQSVQLNTVGTVELEGEMKTLQTGLIVPLSMSISVKNVGRLGDWCQWWC